MIDEPRDLGVAPVPVPASGTLRVGLVADTHIPEARSELWPEVGAAFAAWGVDLILHGGDLHVLEVLDGLERIAPVLAARGNGEDGSGHRGSAPDDARLRFAWRLDVGGIVVGLTHDVPHPEVPPHLTVARWCERRLGRPATAVDVLVHGDTHVERAEVVDGVLCVNPGSPTYPHNLSVQLGTIGLLELDVAGRRVRASTWQLVPGGVEPLNRVPPIEHALRPLGEDRGNDPGETTWPMTT